MDTSKTYPGLRAMLQNKAPGSRPYIVEYALADEGYEFERKIRVRILEAYVNVGVRVHAIHRIRM